MKIWNKVEYDNGTVGLVVTALESELQRVYIDEEPYEVVSIDKSGNNGKWLVVMKKVEQTTAPTVFLLNNGFVRLIDSMGDDLSIVRAARVSYDADWRAGNDEKSDERLIRYLMRNKHTSPFEAVTFTFEIQLPIFLARQWHRHRTWSYNEVSARYTELDLGYYLPTPMTLGDQSKDNKQVRDIGGAISAGQMRKNEWLVSVMNNHMEASFNSYKYLLENGVPRELARIVLPVSSYTRFFGTVDLHNLFHFLRLRLHSHAQYEIREYAEALLGIIEEIVPVAVGAFKETLDG